MVIDCSYEKDCLDLNTWINGTRKCDSCKHNKKRSYYEPRDNWAYSYYPVPYYPIYPQPYYPPYNPIWVYNPGPTCGTSYYVEK